MNQYNNELYHFGVKGMKWGHRKAVIKTQSTGRKRYSDNTDSADSTENTKKKGLTVKQKKALQIGAAAAGTALAAYGAYKVAKFVKNKNVEIQIKKGKECVEYAVKDQANKRPMRAQAIYDRTFRDTWRELRSQGREVDSGFERVVREKARAARDNFIELDEWNNARYAAQRMEEIRNEAEKDSLGKAAKNVYNYYKYNRRKSK